MQALARSAALRSVHSKVVSPVSFFGPRALSAPAHRAPLLKTPAAAEVRLAEAPVPEVAEVPLAAAAPAAPAPPAAPMPVTDAKDFKGDMLKPSVVNTSPVRALAALAAFALASGSTAFIPTRFGAFLHVTAYAIFLGANIWNTFFVGLTMFKNMPRQTFGKVQSVLFPQYFTLTTGCNILMLGSLLLLAPSNSVTSPALSLGFSLACSIGNMLFIEPIATKLMFQRYDLENVPTKTEEIKAQIGVLYKQFGKWHGISSLLNLLITCAAISHGWWLSGMMSF